MLCSASVAATVRDLCFQHGCGTNSPLKELEQMTSPVSLAYEEARIQCLRVPADDEAIVDFADPALVAHRVWTDSGPVYLPAPVNRFLCTTCGRRLRSRGSDAEMSRAYRNAIHCAFCGSSIWVAGKKNLQGAGRRRKRGTDASHREHLICSPPCSGALCAWCCEEVQRDSSFHVRCDWARCDVAADAAVMKHEEDGDEKPMTLVSLSKSASPLLPDVEVGPQSSPRTAPWSVKLDVDIEGQDATTVASANVANPTAVVREPAPPRESLLPVDATLVIDELEDVPFVRRSTPDAPLVPRLPSMMLSLTTMSRGSVGGTGDLLSNAKWEVIWHTDAPHDDAHRIEMEQHFLATLAIPRERLSSRPARNSSISSGSRAWIVFFKTRLSAEDAKDALARDAMVVGSPLVLRRA